MSDGGGGDDDGGGGGRRGYTDPTTAPTTEAPTTAAPTTAAPVPTTAAPVPTQAPTTAAVVETAATAEPETIPAGAGQNISGTIPQTVAETVPETAAASNEAETEIIVDDAVAQVGLRSGGTDGSERSWALLNLILTALAAIIAMGTMKNYELRTSEGKSEVRRAKLLGLIPAAAAIVLFLVTQDMAGRMVMADRWTLITAGLTGLNVITAYLTRVKQATAEAETPEA